MKIKKPPSSPFHDSTTSRLHDAQDSSSLLLFLQMLIAILSLAPLPPLEFLLSFLLVCLSLHHIFKQAFHTRCHLYHFHFLSTSYVRFLLMNIGSLCLSPTCIMFGVINRSYNFALLILLAIDGPHELVTKSSQNPDWTSVSLWHRLCTPTHYFLMPNIPL